MDLVYHVMKSPLYSVRPERSGNPEKRDLHSPQILCKIRPSEFPKMHRDDTDAIVKFIIHKMECQWEIHGDSAGLFIKLRRKDRKAERETMIGKRLAALVTMMATIWIMGTTGAETTPPPFAPETPVPVRTGRPEPEPTPDMPEVINRVSNPDAGKSFHFPMDANILHIWFPNVSNADEAVLIYEDQIWMIDCGDEKMGARGAEMIRLLGIKEIHRLFNSHPHHDHLNGLQETNEAARIRELDICFNEDSTEHMIRALQYAADTGIKVSHYADGDVFSMGEDGAVTLTFYVGEYPALDMNNASASTMVRYGERTILFTADMERQGQMALAARIPARDLKADILKYPHHGKQSLYRDFYEAVSPEIAVFTNRREVPEWEGVTYMNFRKIPCIYTSVLDVYLHLMTDGEHWVVEYVPRTRSDMESSQENR